MTAGNYKTSFYNSLMKGKFFFFLWQAVLLAKSCLHFRLTLIPL
jgi:hypothetical protein